MEIPVVDEIPDGTIKLTPELVNTDVSEISIPDSVKAIASDTFSKCANLKKVVIGVGVEEIEPDAFKDVPDDIVVYVPNFSYCEFLIDSGLPDTATIVVKRDGKNFSTRFFGMD